MGGASVLSTLWHLYKSKENSAFGTLFSEAEFRTWTIAGLKRNVDAVIPRLDKSTIASVERDLTAALGYRKEIATYYNPKTTTSQQHGAFRSVLTEIVATLQGDRARMEQEAKKEAVDGSQEVALDHEDRTLFATQLEAGVKAILDVWHDHDNKTPGTSLACADLVTSSMCKDLVASVQATELCYPHWFDDSGYLQAEPIESVKSARSFLQELRDIRKGLYAGEENEHNAFLLDLIKQSGRQSLPNVPIESFPLSQLRLSFRGELPQLVSALMMHLLRSLRGFHVSTNNGEYSPSKRIDLLESLCRQHPRLIGNGTKMIEILPSVRKAIQGEIHVWSIASVSAWIESNLNMLLNRVLELPLIPTFVHCYDRLLLKDPSSMRSEKLEAFCEKFDNILYWNGRPRTLDDVRKSIDNWILFRDAQTCGRAQVIVRRRESRRLPALQLVQKEYNYWGLGLAKGNVWKDLRSRVEEELWFHDIDRIRRDVFSFLETQVEDEAIMKLDRVNGTAADMNLDIWHLILGQIDSRKDLRNVCLTSRAWFNMAIPHLYKAVPLKMRPHDILDWERKKDPMEFAHSLSSRLLDTKNEQLRNAVHELDFGNFNDNELSDMEKRLVALVDVLPNLQRVKIRGRLTQEVLQDLTGNSRRISLYLLGEDGKRNIESNLQNVVALTAHINPSDESDGPNRRILGIQKLLFACPNLKSFSVARTGGYGGCFSGDETFPPLEELSLNGHSINKAEWVHWQKKVQWSKLRSLSLGPRYTASFLELAADYAKSLRELKVRVYTDADRKTSCPQLEHFLTTFTSLESLTVKGYYLPPGPIGNHPGLKDLCLHSFEPTGGKTRRQTLSVEQLQELDKCCAHLETLELDLYRDGEWPEHILKALAAGFKNLRRLTLHLELGISSVKGFRTADPETCISIEPVLTKDSAQEVGQRFFKWRASSNLNVLVLKTGEPLRRFPQWAPAYTVFEKRNTNTIEVYKPWNTGGVPEVAVMAKPLSLYY
ncbi:hypothetical protein NUW58_g2862 [Xylaria curta]|uniref:Uncharacterized protein n=1 Tax=Xylaria curta TaxID=42375 RepID=A0ACC1PFX9_9PEZI|nr:hypothetical protein NUW58_g2862 [Xylaria curta]